MKKIFTMEWLQAACIRSLKTFAQAMISAIGVEGIGVGEVNWGTACSIALVAAILSILTSLAGLPEVPEK